MKKLNFALLFLILLSFSACDNEPLDEDTLVQAPAADLNGEWTLVSFEIDLNTVSGTSEASMENSIAITSTYEDYNLIFDNPNFSTSGDYNYEAEITSNGMSIPQEPYELTNVSGSGNYVISGYEITLDGQFFEFEFAGVDESLLENESQTLTFALSDDGNTLTFSQNETIIDESTEFSTTVTNVSTSVWERVGVDEEPDNCEEATTAADSAEAAYNADSENSDLCETYKSALENLIAICGDEDGSIQTQIDNLGDCNPDAVTYEIGDIGPAGGYVFYVDDNGGGLELAPIETEFESQWGCYSTDIEGTLSDFGTGQDNTDIILAYHDSIDFYNNPSQCEAPEPGTGILVESTGEVAAKNCDDLVFNGFDDWYLPSIDELELVYTNLHAANLGDIDTGLLASSTQSTEDFWKFYVVNFDDNGEIFDDFKSDLIKHRAIRSF